MMKRQKDIDLVRVKKLSFDERVKLYMKWRKEELARMLAQRDEYEKTVQPVTSPTVLQPNIEAKRCADWKDCINPYYDCINCPIRYPMTQNEPGQPIEIIY